MKTSRTETIERNAAMPIPATWSAQLLSILRIVAGLGFMQHGVSKFFGIPPFPMPLNPLLTVAGTLELVGGALILIGFFTRPVAFVLSGMMAVAYFMAHFPQGFFPAANGGEAAMLYCFIFLYLAAAGGGVWSVDAARGKA
jgi:putative oxidoreductase